MKDMYDDVAISVPNPVTFWVTQPCSQVKYTNLDTVGRPVVVLRKRNVVPEHSVQYLQVAYSFSSAALLAEPLLLVGAFLLFFLSLIAYSRMDLTISKSTAAYQAKIQNEQVHPSSFLLLSFFFTCRLVVW